MWLAGSENQERWYEFRFRPGQLIEGAARYDEGKKQGTMLVEVLEGESTSGMGHWFKGRYIVASDGHLRWWMEHGAGAPLAAKARCRYCETTAVDCAELKKGKSELDAKIPSWAFGRQCHRAMTAYLKARGAEPKKAVGAGPDLPWREPGGEDESKLLVTDTRLIGLVKCWLRPGSEDLLWPQGAHLFRQLFGTCLLRLALKNQPALIIAFDEVVQHGIFKLPCPWTPP